MLRIRTGSRLHFGLFNLAGGPRHFGGVGLMIDEPGIQMCATPAREWSAEGPLSARVREFVHRFGPPLNPQHFRIDRAAPEHAGLGTGTQLGLATARLLAEATGLREDTATLAMRVGRGLRSALGVHGFERGGFLVEAGKHSTELSPLVARADFPDDWRIAVVIPPTATGLHGVPEKEAFAKLAEHPTSASQTDILCRLTLLSMLPALKEHDVQIFGEALYEFNVRVGAMFAPVQGGIYSTVAVGEIVKFLRGEGVAGVGQSSWGPAVFAVVGDADQANALAPRLCAQFSFLLESSVFIARAMNRGAEVNVPCPPHPVI